MTHIKRIDEIVKSQMLNENNVQVLYKISNVCILKNENNYQNGEDPDKGDINEYDPSYTGDSILNVGERLFNQ